MWPTPRTATDDQVYDPVEDSFFLLDCLEQEHNFLETLKSPLVLEIGSGSGIVSTFAHSLIPKASYFATDINPVACEITKKTWDMNNSQTANGIEAIRASLVPFRANSVDVLVFNPPYVPTEDVPPLPEKEIDDKWLYLALDGGKDGMEVTNIVLESLDNILSPTGCAYILFCARNFPDQIKQNMEAKGWEVKEFGTRKAGWERLTVLRFRRTNQ